MKFFQGMFTFCNTDCVDEDEDELVFEEVGIDISIVFEEVGVDILFQDTFSLYRSVPIRGCVAPHKHVGLDAYHHVDHC